MEMKGESPDSPNLGPFSFKRVESEFLGQEGADAAPKIYRTVVLTFYRRGSTGAPLTMGNFFHILGADTEEGTALR